MSSILLKKLKGNSILKIQKDDSRKDILEKLNSRKYINMASIQGAIFNLFFPNSCLICKESADSSVFLCPKCLSELSELKPSVVPVEPNGELEFVFFHSSYSSILGKLIKAYKYSSYPALSGFLAFFLYETINHNSIKIPFIVPVPSHQAAMRDRGFSNTCLILKKLKENFIEEISILNLIGRKDKIYRPQASIRGISERKKNVEDIFFLKNDSLIPEEIIIFDDIFTSGATLNSISKILKGEARTFYPGSVNKIKALVLAKG